MLPNLKKILLFVFVILLSFTTFHLSHVTPTYAQNPQKIFSGGIQELNDEKNALWDNAEKENAAQVSNLAIGESQSNVALYTVINLMACSNTIERCKEQNSQAALPVLGKMIAMLYDNPPASGLAYTQNLLAQAGFAKPVMAQGIGFAGLTPFLPLWKATRNISYTVIILVMVTIGFMVIFRMKIDPKTVISVQAAIPKIVISLILITLSYPIVGFMIDIMYLSMAIIISLIVNGAGGKIGGSTASELQTYYMNSGWWQLLGSVFWGGFRTFDDFFLNWKGLTVSGGFGLLGIVLHVGLGTVIAAGTLATLPAWLLALAPVLLFAAIGLMGLLFTFIRLFLLLLNSYIQLLIALILGPLLLLQEAIPGRSAFAEWILNVVANLSVFPATAMILLFATYLTSGNPVSNNTPLLTPPLIGMPIKGAFDALLGLGVIFLSPTLVASIKKIFHPKTILPFGVGTTFSPVTGAVQTGMGAASQWYYLQQMIGHGDQQGPLGKIFGFLSPKKEHSGGG